MSHYIYPGNHRGIRTANGTLIGVYELWVLLQEDTAKLFKTQLPNREKNSIACWSHDSHFVVHLIGASLFGFTR